MSVLTLAELEDLAGVRAHEHLDRECLLPVATSLVTQGDVMLRRVEGTALSEKAVVIPSHGITVVQGEGGNTHALYGAGRYMEMSSDDELLLGLLEVAEGEQAFLLHPEHGGYQIGCGVWEVRGQREWAGEWRAVAD